VNVRRLWSAALLLLALALAGDAADKDTNGDLMPEGAKARLGTARLRVLTYTPPVLAPDGKSLFVQSSAGLLRLDPATGAALGKPAVQFYGPAVVVSADGKRVAIANANGGTVTDLVSGKALVRIERRLPGGDAVALSADGNVLALGGAGDNIKKDPISVLVWNVAGDKELAKVTVPQNEYANVALSNNGKTLATWGLHRDPEDKALNPDANPAKLVTFWDATTGKEQAKFRVGGFSPSGVAFAPDGSLAAVAGNNGTIELVDTKTGASKHLLLGRSRMGRSLSFSPDGATLAASAEDGAVQRWKVADGSRLSTTEPPVGQLLDTRVRALSAEKGVAWGTRGIAVVVWEVPSGKIISTEGGHTETVRGLAVTPDGKHALTSAADGTTLKWELLTGKPAGTVAIRVPNFGFGGYASAASLSPGATLALVRDTNGVGVHDLATGSQQYVIPTPLDGGSSGAFSPDGSRVVVTTISYNYKKTPGRVAVWDAAAGKRLAALELPGYGSLAAALTPDGKHVVTAGHKPVEKGNGEFVVTAWEVATGAKKGEFTEDGGTSPPHVATAPDNKTGAVVTTKGRLVAFDLATGKLGKTYELNRRVPSAAPVFSPDGKKLAVAGPVEYNPTPTAQLLILDWTSGEVKYTFTAPGGAPGAMVFSPDSKSLVTGQPDTAAIVWDVSN
jgi:WD40 repeat protein